MPGDDLIVGVVSEWVAKAESDLRTAALTLRAEKDCPTDTVCFHAQQCIEKYLKALLVLESTPFPKSHNLFEISKLLPDEWRPDLPLQVLERLNKYATVTRYPGEYEDVTLEEARSAIAAARRVRKGVRAIRPEKALRRRKRR